MIEAEILQTLQAIVAGGVELEDVELLLQERDEGEEPVALQPALIQFFRRQL